MAIPIQALADFPEGRSYVILEASETPGLFRVTPFSDENEYTSALERRVEQRGKLAVKGITVAATVEV